MSFADLGVPANLVERLNAQGITEEMCIRDRNISIMKFPL